MRSVYTRVIEKLESHFAVFVGAVLLLTTLFLQPSAAAHGNRSQHQTYLTEYLESVTTKQTIDPQEFWQFRQTYSPGHFTINEQAITHGQTYTLTALTGDITPLLSYHSSSITSTDSLVKNTVDNQTLLESEAFAEVLVASNSLSVSRDSAARKIRLAFTATPSEMRKANGFFDYTATEQELLEKVLWYNVTVITY